MALDHVTLIPLHSLENSDILRAKSNRNHKEYCWTCSPAIIRYVFSNFEVPSCVYLDADLFFFKSPESLLQDLWDSDSSVFITPSNFEGDKEKYGKYCVQFMPFKNNEEGNKVLDKWYYSCLDWCYDKVENDRFGDQKYLNTWIQEFDSVSEIDTPLSVSLYYLDKTDEDVIKNLLFFHFNCLDFYEDGYVDCGFYQIPGFILNKIYVPYFKTFLKIINILKGIDTKYEFVGRKVNLPKPERLKLINTMISVKVFNWFRLSSLMNK